MTLTCAKIGDTETIKDGIISKLHSHIVLQRRLLIVIHLFSSRFKTNDYWTLLCYRMTFTFVSEPRGPLLVDFYMFRTPMSQFGHHTLTFNDVYVRRKVRIGTIPELSLRKVGILLCPPIPELYRTILELRKGYISGCHRILSVRKVRIWLDKVGI